MAIPNGVYLMPCKDSDTWLTSADSSKELNRARSPSLHALMKFSFTSALEAASTEAAAAI